MNKSRKIYIGILAVALLALAWDKMSQQDSVLQPQVSQAQPTANSPSTYNYVQKDWEFSPFVMKVLSKQNQEVPINDLNYLRTRDLFTLTRDYDQAMSKPSQSNETPEEDDLDTQQEEINLQLSSIVRGPLGDQALINGQVVMLGQTIGPYQLLKINSDAVFLRSKTEYIYLPLGELSSRTRQEGLRRVPINFLKKKINPK